MKRADIILIALALLSALVLGLLMRSGLRGSAVAVVYVDGEEYARLPLDAAERLVIRRENGSTNVVRTDGGGNVCMESSTCKNQLCVERGTMSAEDAGLELAGWIVCLPNGVSVHIEEEP